MNRRSKYVLLTDLETAQAAAQGWGLHHVFDGTSWKVMILGNPSAEKAGAFVMSQARTGNGLAIKALQLIAANKGN